MFDRSKLIFNKQKNTNETKLEKIINFKSKNKKIVEVKQISQIYKKHRKEKKIFENLSFDIYEGDRLALLGHNGAGKTTIVEIIAGYKKPTNGEVIKNFEKDTPAQKQIGVQFQDLSFPKSLTVYDIIKFSIDLDNSNVDYDEISEMLDVFLLKDYFDISISKLSGGQQQRLNVLLSLINKPRLLFLDEFTTGLDIAIKNNIKNFISSFCDKYKITLVMISHDIDIMADMANRVILISKGELLVDSSMKDINKKFGNFSKMINKYISY